MTIDDDQGPQASRGKVFQPSEIINQP